MSSNNPKQRAGENLDLSSASLESKVTKPTPAILHTNEHEIVVPRISRVPLRTSSYKKRLSYDGTNDQEPRSGGLRFPQDVYTGPSGSFYRRPRWRQTQAEGWFLPDDRKSENCFERNVNVPSASALNLPSHPLSLHEDTMTEKRRRLPSETFSEISYGSAHHDMGRGCSMVSYNSMGSEVYDPEDPRVTGIKSSYQKESDEITMRKLDYKARQKLRTRIRIEFNLSPMEHRQEFLLKLARALMTFGAPSHRIESQLVAAARILEVESEFIHLPGVMICSFGDQDQDRSETHFVKCNGRLSLGALHKVHLIYRSVVHDETSAEKAAEHLETLLTAPPLYGKLFRSLLAFSLSALICPLAFGGSFADMWIAGASGFVLSVLQLCIASRNAIYGNVFEITIAILISFMSRGLSSIRSRIFCYTAISSAGIVGILPGYLILSSSLELASKNIVCGSVRMVYALIYTLFLGFGLQIGSDFYLLLDPEYRRQLEGIATSLSTTVSMVGTWVADNGTSNSSLPLTGTWTFSHSARPIDQDIHEGCYRPKRFPWYLQPFPLWTSFIIVPLFSTLSSLANLQPIWSKQLPVMVIISCCSYASNKIANHFIFNRSDVVSAIGAFTVGILGNIYSRKMRGTAFTSMVTGVLFLVPSGLSQAGGITASGNGIDIGGAMVAVTIGITVGLFMSQALVYTFGTRKNAAVFSF